MARIWVEWKRLEIEAILFFLLPEKIPERAVIPLLARNCYCQ